MQRMAGLTERGYNRWLSAEYGVLAGEAAFVIWQVAPAGGLEKSVSQLTEWQLTAFLTFLALAMISAVARARIGRPSTNEAHKTSLQ